MTPAVGSIRMSSGPSARNEKPRSARSIWGELTPRSSRTPDRGPSPAEVMTSSNAENGDRINVTRSPNEVNRSRAASSATGSRSNPTTRSPGYASSNAAA